MQKTTESSRWLASSVITLSLGGWLLAASMAGTTEADPQPVLEFPASTEFTVFELVSTSPVIADPKEAPALRIYGDGRAHVSRPSFFRDSGDFETYLNPSDLRVLVSYCASKGLMELDRRAVQEEYRAAALARQQQTGSVPGVTDAETTMLTIRLSEYVPAGSDTVNGSFEKTIYWYALSDVVSWYPEIEALSNFKDVVDVLRSIQDAVVVAAKKDEPTIRLPALQRGN